MSKIKNPFIVKGRIPSEYFCDRVEETKKLTRELLAGNDVVIMSSRRLGKTGLVQHCFDQSVFEEDYYTFFIDILETSSLRDFTYAFGKCVFETLKPKGRKFVDTFVQTLKSLQAGWGYDPISGMPKFTFSIGAITNPQVTLNEIFTLIEKADKRCIVAIDEFQQITKYPEKNVEAVLRGFIQHLSNCDFIFAGSERHLLTEMFSTYGRPFYNSTSSLHLDPILKEH
jgi:AAA+ ATPase superfamily predicted ATPase